MNPPVAAAVFAVDEKPQIQAFEPDRPDAADAAHHPARATHDYERNGTCDLFAALKIATGTVITDIRPRHTSADFVAFLNKVNREVPAELDVHVILDNLATHKTPDVQNWLLRHRRFHFHFTPTYGSWMNLVERWFSALTTKKLQRSAHRSVKELAADIQAWAAHWNENPTPFVWHKTADQILERLAGYCAAMLKRSESERSFAGVSSATRPRLTTSTAAVLWMWGVPASPDVMEGCARRSGADPYLGAESLGFRDDSRPEADVERFAPSSRRQSIASGNRTATPIKSSSTSVLSTRASSEISWRNSLPGH